MIGAGSLARFQDDFARAFIADDSAAPSALSALTRQPAFAVYRNTVMKACIDALQANYPVVTRLVGEEWFRAAAALFVRESLPTVPMLLEYGAAFADFLARFEPAAELPYLPGVARLDRYWTEAHIAASEDTLNAIDLQQLIAADGAEVRLQPRSSARWAWFEEAPVYTIWAGNRGEAESDGDIDWRPEGALITRPDDVVIWRPLGRDGCAFLDACANGDTVADALQRALEVNAEADTGTLIAELLAAGAFRRMDSNPEPK